MRYLRTWVIAFVWLIATPALAHEVGDRASIVIDTDMGLDDAVTLAMALQNPRVKIVGLVACEGAAGAEKSVELLERMLELFNRQEIPLYGPAGTAAPKPPPPFRAFAENSVGRALPAGAKRVRRAFCPEAYVTEGGQTVVLVLGPLTNLAAALRARPGLKEGIAEVIVAGRPEADRSWNLRYDRDATAVVQAAGVGLKFVAAGPGARKPECWREGDLRIGPGTSIGEAFVARLLEAPQVRQHYMEQLGSFHDELVFLYHADATLFSRSGERNVLVPEDREGVLKLLTGFMSDGRQVKERVVFIDGVLPDEVFREGIRKRKASIIANNGEVEWFAQLLLSEFHEHLGAYSVIGVKMGLRAAELLNAPQHGMKIVSHVPLEPPVGCLNDGLMVSTGCTPGRGLFTCTPGRPGCVAASFECNGRRITLALKAQYRGRIRAEIEALRQKHTLEDHGYWAGVRGLGLDIWENWHRRDLFEVNAGPAEAR